MFSFWNKKIQFPETVYCIAWSAETDKLIIGGAAGMLKVIQFAGSVTKTLSLNVSCLGHVPSSVRCVAWNDVARNFAAGDADGVVKVWKVVGDDPLDRVLSIREDKRVRDLRWAADGRKIVIVCDDGHVAVVREDGRRVWGRDMRSPLRTVEWSPNGRHLVMGFQTTEVQLVEGDTGDCLASLPTTGVPAESRETAHVVGIHWYDGTDGYLDPSAPTLALGFSDGTVILMRSEADDTPIVFQTGVAMTTMRWNWQGTVLAVGGVPTQNDPLHPPTATPKGQVRFFDPYGKLLRIQGMVSAQQVCALAWERSGLNIAVTTDTSFFLATIRPFFHRAFLRNTFLWADSRVENGERNVVFWNIPWGTKHTRKVAGLVQLRGSHDTCMLVTRDDELGRVTMNGECEGLTDPTVAPHVIQLCNETGALVDSKKVGLRPATSALSEHFAVVCSEDVVYVWQFRSIVTKHGVLDPHASTSPTQQAQEQRDRVFYIDETVQPWPGDMTQSVDAVTAASFPSANTLAGQARGADPITCCTISKTCILIGRESGVVHQYGLPAVGLVNKFVVSPRPQQLALNMSGSTLAVIDSNSLLTFYTMQPEDVAVEFAGVPQPAERVGPERKEVWDILWAEDDDHQFATMEKQRVVLFRDFEATAPRVMGSHLVSFRGGEVTTANLDEALADADAFPLSVCAVRGR